ncbi:MAG: outer membrane beta-barrel protein [Tenacibaculum sp.]
MNTLSVSYTNITDNTFNFVKVDSKPNIYFYSNNAFKINESTSADLTFWYLGEKYYGIYADDNRYSISISLKKSFFDNALNCTLTANDILHSVIASGTYNVAETDIYYNRI